MRKTVRKNQGITLIALVITIIVLLILAGVAIAMLSGENGILKKATEAKTRTEESSLYEQIKLAVMEASDYQTMKIDRNKIASSLGIDKGEINGDARDVVLKKNGITFNIKNGKVKEVEELSEADKILDSYFYEKGAKYRCRYGYLTGIEVKGESKELREMIEECGYKLCYYDEEDGTIKDMIDEYTLSTGVLVVKDGETVETVVGFGDITEDEVIDTGDLGIIVGIVNSKSSEGYKDYQKVAMDVNHDGKITQEDAILLSDYIRKSGNLNQQAYSVKASEITIE